MLFTRFLVVLAFSALYLSAYALSVDSITVAGRVRNISESLPRTIIINECDISGKTAKEIYEFKEDGYFCQKIPLSYPHTITINYNRRNFINAFAAPGDSIYMDIDASTSPLSVTFSGDNADINQQYDRAFQYMNPFYWSVNLPADTIAFEEFMPVFEKYVQQGRDSIDCYAIKNKLSDEVKSMLYVDNTYILANLALGYGGKSEEDKRAFFLDSIFDIFNEDNSKVMMFPYHISAIMNHFPDVRDKAPKGIVRDIMYACDEDVVPPERDVFFNQKYYARLYDNNESVGKVSIDDIKSGDMIVLVDGMVKEISDENPLRWLANEYKGRPIYLDVSATWCGPCRPALNGSESLRKHFKDTDITFAVIWLQSEKEAWVKLAPTISNSIQIFIDNQEMTDRIRAYLPVKAFPSYFMIDRDGKIINEGVPRYMSAELPDFLNSYK